MVLLKEDSVVKSTAGTGSLFQTLITLISEKTSSGFTGVIVLI